MRLICLILILICFCADVTEANDAYPSERRTGLTGGLWSDVGLLNASHVKNRTTVFATLTTSDSLSTVNSTIASCPSNQVVAFAAGSYSYGNGTMVLSKNGVTLRGATNSAGMPTTIWTDVFVRVGASDWPSSHWGSLSGINISSGLTEGSTSIVLASSPSAEFAAGDIFMVDALDDGTLVTADSGSAAAQCHRSGRSYTQLLRITSISGTTINFEPPLLGKYWGFLSDPEAVAWRSTDGATYHGLGIENIDISDAAPGSYMMTVARTFNTRIHNVKITGWPTSGGGTGIQMPFNVNFDVTWCWFYDQGAVSSSSYALEVRAARGGFIAYNSFTNLALAIPVVSMVGTVFFSNVGIGPSPYDPDTWLPEYMGFTHGGHCHFNLYDGNYTFNIYFDQVFDTSDSHNGIVRNRIPGDCYNCSPTKTSNRIPIVFDGDKTTNTILANILGFKGTHTTYSSHYDIGGSGNSGNIRTNNWNMADAGQNSGETLSGSDSVRDSYVFDTKPADFGKLSFPTVTISGATSLTNNMAWTNWPAGYRMWTGQLPEAQSGSSPTAPSGLSASAVSSSQINLSWTDNASDEDGFEVDRALDSGFSSGLTTTGGIAADATSYNSTGLSAATTYYYRVRATNAFGASSYSSSANSTTHAAASGPGTTGIKIRGVRNKR